MKFLGKLLSRIRALRTELVVDSSLQYNVGRTCIVPFDLYGDFHFIFHFFGNAEAGRGEIVFF